MKAKRRLKAEEKNEDDDIDDRISTLPDALLRHILSFLPTDTCVRTSLISRRWRYLWKTLQVFDFHDYSQHNAELFMSFTVFVNAVLALRSSPHIRKFCLLCYDSEPKTFYTHSVNAWIRTAVGPHLQEFHLRIEGDDFTLPITLFSCSNLLSLSLDGCIEFELQDSSEICLPSLKVMKLGYNYSLDMNSLNILLSGCPILETLEILSLGLGYDELVSLRVPSSLKSLKITVEVGYGICLEIDAPALKYLSLAAVTFLNAATIGENLHNVEEADLDLFSHPDSESVEPLLKLLRALSGLKHLELHSPTTQWLFSSPILDIPEFHYLVYLKVSFPSFNLSFLFDVLQKCPVLQTLITYDDQEDPTSVTDDPSPSHGWAVKPKNVPNCLISHLTFIDFQDYEGNSHELEFIAYVLLNGLVLKTMLIGGCWMDQPEELEKKISDLPRGSAICQVKFDYDASP
ncbi:putative F-box domain, FBD domain, leucine-rich repeat domain, L domain-containing protein [Medicago truncatula]|uniref:F-box/RNI/FBD-like domain protein n=1 Tax=Medicago truncatula TaxID=3880 RepID=A0A072TRB3_MEDTR|nr:F-box/FBD/LRR-repeat protein At4g26340 [Medicago truncatula]KEH19756.1 F-box/RNI/FBD-like domain protein [Medicago truncatula]RHN41067.1 putative F-box domain, FBD domain, leucine-rich repeat domain, L domain-containing protein [Medicago truncatula]